MREWAAAAALTCLIAGRACAEGLTIPADPAIPGMISEVSLSRIQRSIFVLASFRTRHTLSDSDPGGDGIGASAAWIRAEFGRISAAAGNRLQVQTDDFDIPASPPATAHPARATNILAILPGTPGPDASRLIALVAPYDCRTADPVDTTSAAPGANVNASGVAAMIEMARILSLRSFPATIVFAAVSGSEQGCRGSEHWAEALRLRGEDVGAVVVLDAIGNSHRSDGTVERGSARLFAPGIGADSPARELARIAAGLVGRYVTDFRLSLRFRSDSALGGGDQLVFAARGFPAVRLTEAVDDPRHARRAVRESDPSTGDRTDFVDFAYASDVTKTATALVAGLARAPGMPKPARLVPAPTERDTAVAWTPLASGSDVSAYRIVWRDTTAPTWEHSIDVPANLDRAVIPGVAPDEALFGVEAVNAAGDAGLAAFAQ